MPSDADTNFCNSDAPIPVFPGNQDPSALGAYLTHFDPLAQTNIQLLQPYQHPFAFAHPCPQQHQYHYPYPYPYPYPYQNQFGHPYPIASVFIPERMEMSTGLYDGISSHESLSTFGPVWPASEIPSPNNAQLYPGPDSAYLTPMPSMTANAPTKASSDFIVKRVMLHKKSIESRLAQKEISKIKNRANQARFRQKVKMEILQQKEAVEALTNRLRELDHDLDIYREKLSKYETIPSPNPSID
jgi:hypothetical protein